MLVPSAQLFDRILEGMVGRKNGGSLYYVDFGGFRPAFWLQKAAKSSKNSRLAASDQLPGVDVHGI